MIQSDYACIDSEFARRVLIFNCSVSTVVALFVEGNPIGRLYGFAIPYLIAWLEGQEKATFCSSRQVVRHQRDPNQSIILNDLRTILFSATHGHVHVWIIHA
jgi:hypothetical protein